MGRRIIIRRKNKVALELEQVWTTLSNLITAGMEGWGDCIDHVDRSRIIKKQHSEKTNTIQNKQKNNKKC